MCVGVCIPVSQELAVVLSIRASIPCRIVRIELPVVPEDVSEKVRKSRHWPVGVRRSYGLWTILWQHMYKVHGAVFLLMAHLHNKRSTYLRNMDAAEEHK